MALVYTRVASRPDLRETVTDVTLDGSYGAGGYAVSNAGLGLLSNADAMDISYSHPTAASGNVAQYQPVTNKIMIFEAGTAAGPLAECSAGDITSSHKMRVVAKGNVVV